MTHIWSEDELMRWAYEHSDAWHPGSREDCSHCQAMIEWLGPMPEKDVIIEWARKRDRAAARIYKAKHIIPEAIRWQVWERDNFTCQHCGSRRYLAIDHIIAVSKGGANDISNYQTLCRRCNSKKGAR